MNLERIVKTLELNCTPKRAFSCFTEEIGKWWPLSSHSLAGEKHFTCAFEAQKGGRLFEKDTNGNEFEWGRILEWDPPRKIVFTWRVGKAITSKQQVEVSFSETKSGTRVRLVHGHWTADSSSEYEGYRSGWDVVLDPFVMEICKG